MKHSPADGFRAAPTASLKGEAVATPDGQSVQTHDTPIAPAGKSAAWPRCGGRIGLSWQPQALPHWANDSRMI
jgi:hypothetical protein